MPRDFTQYLFNGREYGKGKLVLSVIREHVSKNTTITFDQLVNDFPDRLQANSAIQFSEIQAVVKKFDEITDSEKKRFHVNPDEIITVSNTHVAVSREWNKENILNFINRAAELGYSIKTLNQMP